MIRFCLIVVTVFFMTGCSVVPVTPEFDLPPQDVSLLSEDLAKVHLIIFNDSNRYLYGADRTGKMNVMLDGKNAGTLNTGQYLILIIDKGEHEIGLYHRDILNFRTSHKSDLQKSEQYLKIFVRPVSNGTELLEKQHHGKIGGPVITADQKPD